MTPGIGWKPMAELVRGTKSDCFRGEAGDPWGGLPPPLMRLTRAVGVSSVSESDP
jgi:hypothetical protein